jgi:hypothetical protein
MKFSVKCKNGAGGGHGRRNRVGTIRTVFVPTAKSLITNRLAENTALAMLLLTFAIPMRRVVSARRTGGAVSSNCRGLGDLRLALREAEVGSCG